MHWGVGVGAPMQVMGVALKYMYMTTVATPLINKRAFS